MSKIDGALYVDVRLMPVASSLKYGGQKIYKDFNFNYNCYALLKKNSQYM